MITGIELSCGYYDGKIANIKTPLPFVLIINGQAYYRIEETTIYECVHNQRVLQPSELITPIIKEQA